MERRSKLKRFQSNIAGAASNNKCAKTNWDSIWLCPEILEQIFKNLDFERLKIYRLVCKIWNQEICRVMNATAELAERLNFQSRLTTAKGDHGGPREEQLLKLLHAGAKLNLPVPFKSLRMSPKWDKTPKTNPVRELSAKIPIIKITFSDFDQMYNPEFTKYVMGLLSICSETLIHLEIQYWDIKNHCPETTFRLPRLKNLVLRRRVQCVVRSDAHDIELLFFSTIISSSPNLKALVVNNIVSLPVLLQSVVLGGVESLTLYGSLYFSRAQGWIDLKNTRIDHLKALTLGFGVCGMDPEKFKSLISRFSKSIEQLRVSEYNIQKLPFCPKLTYLNCHSLSAEAGDPDVLPALQSLKLEYFTAPSVDTSCRPFQSVQEICIGGIVDIQGVRPGTDEKTKVLVGQLVDMFPNATKWTVPETNLREFIQAARLSELNLECLTVGMRGEDLFNGCSTRGAIAVRKRYTETFASLSYFPGLKELTLETNGVETSTNLHVKAIDFARLEKLRTFRHIGLGWTSYLDLKEHLRSLDAVVIHNRDLHPASEEAQEQTKLLTQIPNLEFVFSGKYK